MLKTELSDFMEVWSSQGYVFIQDQEHVLSMGKKGVVLCLEEAMNLKNFLNKNLTDASH